MATLNIGNLNKVDWEEGWHFVRLLAQTEDGDLIPLVDEGGHPLPWAADDDDVSVPRPNESDLFTTSGCLSRMRMPPAWVRGSASCFRHPGV
jgi:hypothetical protein